MNNKKQRTNIKLRTYKRTKDNYKHGFVGTVRGTHSQYHVTEKNQ